MSAAKRVSDIKRAEDTEGVLVQTHIGGQALLGGIMMRGKYNWAVAVRTPEGDIYTEEHDLGVRPDEHSWLNWPIVRGCRALVESLTLGYKALEVATENAFDFDEDEDEDEYEGKGKGRRAEKTGGDGAAPVIEDVVTASGEVTSRGTDEDAARAMATLDVVDMAGIEDNATVSGTSGTVGAAGAAASAGTRSASAEGSTSGKAARTASTAAGTTGDDGDEDGDGGSEAKGAFVLGTVLGLVLGVAAFIMLPAFLSNLVVGNYNDHPILWNIFDGVVRVAIFIFYMWIISFMSDIKCMYRYHGAEHKTIHCFEHGLELTPQNAAQFTTLHVRCGTAFTIMVLILAIIVYSVVPLKSILIGLGLTGGVGQYFAIIAVRIVLLPIIAGIGYEITVKWAGAHPEKKAVRVVLWPGLQMQRLTTAEPDEGMLECAIAAMKIVVAREELEEKRKREKEAGTVQGSGPVDADESGQVGQTGQTPTFEPAAYGAETASATPVAESYAASASITTTL